MSYKIIKMKRHTHINLNDIDYIEFTPRKQLNYRWYEYSPPVKKFFGLWTKRKGLEAGWCDRGGFHYSFGGRPTRVTTEKLLRDGSRFYSEGLADGIQWFEKTEVYIQKRNSPFAQYFDTDEEALDWIESIKEKSGDKFEVIINE